MQALGMIETKGLIGAIESADTMPKAAEVALLEKNAYRRRTGYCLCRR